MTLSMGKNQGIVVKMTALAIVLAFAVSAFAPLATIGSDAAPAPEAVNALGTQLPESLTTEPPQIMTSVPEPIEPDTIVIQPNATDSKDTWISNDTAFSNLNYGISDTLSIGNNNFNQDRTLIQFSMPTKPVKLLQATLQLYSSAISGVDRNISAYGVSESWAEGFTAGTAEATNWSWRFNTTQWATSGGDYYPSPSSYINITPVNGWYSWNVTAIVRNWVTSSWANNGFLLKVNDFPAGTNLALFWSSDYTITTLRPKLILTYAAEITDPVPAQAFNEDDPAATISLSGRGNGTITSLTGPNDSSDGLPLYGNSAASIQTHYLYNASKIKTEGKIMRISFLRDSALDTGRFNNFKVQMAHTNRSVLTSTFSSNYLGNLIEVFPTQTLFVNSSNLDSWFSLDLNGNFTYDSQYNLLVNISWTSGTDDIGTRCTTGAPDAVGTCAYSIIGTDTAVAVEDTLPVIKFFIDAVDNAVYDKTKQSGNYWPFGETASLRTQLLYNHTFINQTGIIDKIAFQCSELNPDWLVMENLSIRLAHSGNSTLSTTYEWNRNSPWVEVLNVAEHNFTSKGRNDWMVVDVNNLFTYNNVDNLLIEFRYVGSRSNDAAIFPWFLSPVGYNSRLNALNNSAVTGTVSQTIYAFQALFADSANLTWSASNSAPTMFTAGVSGRTLTITPLPNQFGTGTVTLYLSNSNGGFVTQDIPVTITAVNDVPILAALANLLCVEDEPKALNISTSITDIDDLIGDIKVTTTSNYDTINGTVITFTYPEGVTGETITVTVTDKSGLSATQQLVTTVTMVNDKPQFTGFVSNITCDATLPEQIALIPTDEETSAGHLKIYTNSEYVNVSGHTLHLLYPKGIGSEQVTINLVDNLTYGVLNNVSFLLNVTIIDHPEVTTYLPTGVAIPVTTTVQTTFDIAMNKTKAQNAFSMTLGTVVINGNFTWNTNKTVMTFTPLSHLTNGLYVVRIAASAENTAGIKMLNAFEWNFTAELGSFDGDGDGMTDQWEMDNDLDPNANDAQNDSDGDSMPNIYEFENELDPQINDALNDADNDGMPNIYEFENDLDPQVNDADLDSDDDGATNLEEYEEGTDPNDPDSKPSEFTWIIWVIILIAIIAVVAIVLVLMTRKPKSVQLQQAYEQGQEDAELDQEAAEEGNPPPPEGWNPETPQGNQPPQQGSQ